jgi:hypothetical protein
MKVTQVNRNSESPTPVGRRANASSSSSRSRSHDPDAEMDDVQYLGGLSDTDSEAQYWAGVSDSDEVHYLGGLSGTEGEDSGSAEAGPSALASGSGARGYASGKSRFFS